MLIRVYALWFAALFCLWLAGCGTQPQLPVQYATLKLLERETVTPTEVVDGLNRVRALIDDGMTLADLGGQVREAIGYQYLPASDRLLVDAILGDVAHRLDVGLSVPLSQQHTDAIHETLHWIEQAAGMY